MKWFKNSKISQINAIWENRESRRVIRAIFLILTLFSFGTFGYYILGNGEWEIIDCAYMTFITFSTVGYSEVFDISNRPDVKIFTMILITFGLGVFTYYFSFIVTHIIEGDLKDYFGSKKMLKRTKKLKDHIIVCGAGSSGLNAIEELVHAHKEVVIVENDETKLEFLLHKFNEKIPVIIGDASNDSILMDAGIKNAFGLISSLSDDKENMYTIITAKSINPNLKIITKSIDPKAVDKFRSVGTDHVVSSKKIAGIRMAIKMISPLAVNFIESLLQHGDNKYRLDSIIVSEKSRFVNDKLGHINFRKFSKALILGYRYEGEKEFTYLPNQNTVFKANMELIMLARDGDVIMLKDYINKSRYIT